MNSHTNTHERGFIALVSVVVMSAILLVLLLTLGVSSFLNRFDVLDTENKRVSLGLAEACVNMAMIKIAENPSYAPVSGGECVRVGGDLCPNGPQVCKICQTSPSIVTRAVYNGAYTNLEVEGSISGANFVVTKWLEVAPNPVSTCTLP